jgi:hypothetical protein
LDAREKAFPMPLLRNCSNSFVSPLPAAQHIAQQQQFKPKGHTRWCGTNHRNTQNKWKSKDRESSLSWGRWSSSCAAMGNDFYKCNWNRRLSLLLIRLQQSWQICVNTDISYNEKEVAGDNKMEVGASIDDSRYYS